MARVAPRLVALFLATSSTDRSDEVSKVEITSAASDSDFQSFLESRSGGARDYAIELTIAQDHASATLWDTIWTGAGTTVTGKYAPYGNATATVSQPHYTFSAVVSEPDGRLMGGESNSNTRAVATVDLKWALTAKPVKVTA